MVLFDCVPPWRARSLSLYPTPNGLGEVAGYIGRVGSSYDVTYNNYFVLQLCSLIVAPAFFSAGLYATIGILYHFINPT